MWDLGHAKEVSEDKVVLIWRFLDSVNLEKYLFLALFHCNIIYNKAFEIILPCQVLFEYYI